MKVGIITFHAALNYGSVLQTYALQEYLAGRGHDVSVIDFRSLAQRKLYPAPVSFNSIYNTKQTFRRLASPSRIYEMSEKRASFRRFVSRYLHLTPGTYKSEKALRNEEWDSFDVIVSGSDQIWNPEAWDHSTAYFIDFTDKVRKVAYAPSIGQHPERIGGGSRFRELLSDYEALSVRELRSAEFLNRNGVAGRDIPVLPDPVLLHGADFWKTVASPSVKESGYIFYYSPGRRSSAAEFIADSLASGFMEGPAMEGNDGRKMIRKAGTEGPDGFISLVGNSLYTVGTSFHLMVFSMIFGKDYWCPDIASDSRKAQLAGGLGLDPDSGRIPFSDPAVHQAACAVTEDLRNKADGYFSALGL